MVLQMSVSSKVTNFYLLLQTFFFTIQTIEFGEEVNKYGSFVLSVCICKAMYKPCAVQHSQHSIHNM